MSEKKSSIFVNTLVILIVTFVAVAGLAVVYQVTKEPIAQAEANAKAAVYASVFAEANGFTEVENAETLIDASQAAIENAELGDCSVNEVLTANGANGEALGYVIAATSPNGYGGDIQIAVGISNEGVITGFNVISNNETAGLGSKCTNADFTSQFEGKNAEILKYTKTGAVADDEIDAISGATRTTNAVTQAVNTAIIFYQESFTEEITVRTECLAENTKGE